MKILFIHGMNQQKYTAQSLQKYWCDIFNQGINDCHISLKSPLNIQLAFYGDLITAHHLSNHFDVDTLLPKFLLDFHVPYFSKKPSSTLVPHISSIPTFSSQHPMPIKTQLYLASQIIKDSALREFVLLLNHFPQLHESLIHRFLIETYLYLDNPTFLQEVHQRVLSCLDPREEYIIVAHSLGTVIAYNLLQHIHSNYTIRRFITLGSPLAFRVIQSKITHPIVRPMSLHGDWFNFYSRDDFLTAFPLSDTPFNFEPPIFNQQIHTFINHPHNIIGYLQHPAVIQAILKLILTTQPPNSCKIKAK